MGQPGEGGLVVPQDRQDLQDAVQEAEAIGYPPTLCLTTFSSVVH